MRAPMTGSDLGGTRQQRARRLRWLVWMTLAMDAACAAVTAWLFVRGGAPTNGASQYGGSIGDYLFGGAELVSLGLGALLVLKRPFNPVGWLLLGGSSVAFVDQAVSGYVVYAIRVTNRALPGADLLGTLDQMAWIPEVIPVAIFLPLVFPTGSVLSRRWRILGWVALVASVLGFIGGTFPTTTDRSGLIQGVHPLRAPTAIAGVADALQLAIAVLPVCVVAAIVSMALRYRRAGPEERHQLKWLIFAISIYAAGFGLSLVPLVLRLTNPGFDLVGVTGLALIPAATAIAVLKYRLYDIDVVISRTLVYGFLAAFITAVYVAIVVGVGTLVGSSGRPNLLLSIAATAVVAVAFQPVRERVQRVANRLVYGRRSTPYEVLSEFSSRVAESYAGEQVLPRMARLLAEGTGARRAEVWLRTGQSLRAAAVWPEGDDGQAGPVLVELTGQLLPEIPESDRAVPVRHQGELLGALSVRKRAGESLTPMEEKLLDDLAHQAGLVLKNVGLTADLQARLDDLRASRQRLVKAQDDERRRLERNLHDGAQQHLVALKVKLGLAEALAVRDPDRARQTIQQLKLDADEALETLRDLARGIYPPLLADKGLMAALQAQGRKATLPVEVRAAGLPRYPQEVEAAVYFCCLEALQNVQKYASATSVRVEIKADREQLGFAIIDDGVGFDASSAAMGTGLRNMHDRLEALGGGLEIVSAPGRGTAVRGTLSVLDNAADSAEGVNL